MVQHKPCFQLGLSPVGLTQPHMVGSGVMLGSWVSRQQKDIGTRLWLSTHPGVRWLDSEQFDFMDDFGKGRPVLAKGHGLWGHRWEARSEEALAAVGATALPAPWLQLGFGWFH